MKFKLDENLSHELGTELRALGHDVHTVAAEGLAGSSDPIVLVAVREEGRMLLTQDRGFADLRRYPPGSHLGIVVLRPSTQDPEAISQLLRRFLGQYDLAEFEGCNVVVEPTRVRVRRPDALPPVP